MARPASVIAKGGNMKAKISTGKHKFMFLSYLLIFFLLFQIGFVSIPTVKAGTTLNLTKGSWDIIGLDSNKPETEGPHQFVIQVHVTNTGNETATNVCATLSWTSDNSYINLDPHEQNPQSSMYN